MNRFQAGAIHLAISASVAALVFIPIYFVWYPDVLFESAGGRELFFIITGVDVVLGPIVTTIVYRTGKWGMKFDLVFIGVLQCAALAWGVSVLYASRPVYVVFVKDRYELVRASEIAQQSLGKSKMEDREALSFIGPKLVGALLPDDPDERFKVGISGFGGVDVQAYPEYHVPYDKVRAQVRRVAQPIDKLRALNPGKEPEIERMLARIGKGSTVRFVPMRAGKIDLTVLVDPETGDVLRLAALRPWSY